MFEAIIRMVGVCEFPSAWYVSENRLFNMICMQKQSSGLNNQRLEHMNLLNPVCTIFLCKQ